MLSLIVINILARPAPDTMQKHFEIIMCGRSICSRSSFPM
jgi:hypothetical protein